MNTDKISVPHANNQSREGEPRFTRLDLALLLLLGALVALFFWRILTPNPADRAQFPVGDFTDQFYAFRLYIARALTEGRVPLWSENFNSGHPFLADIQSQVFYPPALVNMLLNLAFFKSFSLFALELEALFHFYLAGAFTYLFARRALKNRVGAFTSALVFTFGGYLTSYPSLQLAILETAAWLPLALYCLERGIDDRPPTADRTADSSFVVHRPPSALRHPSFTVPHPSSPLRPSWLICTGIVLGVAATAGHPQTLLFTIAVCVIYFVWRNAQIGNNVIRNRAVAVRVLLQIALMVVIAFGVAAIQWIPAMEYQQLSTREALSFADAAKGFPTLDLLQLILPGFTSAFASPLYVGVLPLWLAIFALAGRRTADGRRQGSEAVFWGLLALGALILSFGFYVFAYVIFYLFVPGAALFRDQERLAFVVSFALAMLAGYGITALLNGFDAKRVGKLYALLPVGAALMLALLLTFLIAGTQNTEGRILFLGDRAGLMLILFALASLLLGLYIRKTISVKWFVPLAIALILFDAWSVNEPANKGQVQDRFADIPFAQQLEQDTSIFRVAADAQALPGHFGIATGLQEIGGISPLRLARYDALLKLPAFLYLPLLNVSYAITRSPEAFDGQVVGRENDLALVKLNAAQPRAWLVGNTVVEPNDAPAADTLGNHFDFNETALVPTALPIALDARAAGGTATVAARAAERDVFDVNTPADGLLVVSENFYPGWRATVDGQATDILRADLTLRAVPVRAGQHRIEMWYDPLSFKLGAVVSVLMLLMCGGALLFFRIARK